MTFPSKKHSQFELFPGSLDHHNKGRKQISLAPITVTWENAVIGIIVFVMGMIVAFSFGVEKGKKLKAQKALPEAVQKVRQEAVLAVEQQQGLEEGGVGKIEKIGEKLENLEENAQKIEETSIINSKKNKSIDKVYSVQVASFKHKQRADLMAADISRLGYDAFAVAAGSHYVVCIGRFPDKDGASDMRRTLLKKYPDCLIRSL